MIEPFPMIGISILSPVILWAVFAVIVICFIAISWVLHFHWKNYGLGKRAVILAESTYFIGGMGLLGGAFAALLSL